MLKDWSADHRLVLTAAFLTGTPLSFIRDNLAVKGTGVPFLPRDEFYRIRDNKWRNLKKQLGRFQLESSSDTPKRPGVAPTRYEVVPQSFKFSDIVELKADSTEQLPVFTSEHYKNQFNKPALPKSPPKNMSRSKAKRSSGSGRAP